MRPGKAISYIAKKLPRTIRVLAMTVKPVAYKKSNFVRRTAPFRYY